MILVDANILIYAYDRASPVHRIAREWVEDVFSDSDPVRLAWSTIDAFLRITTHASVFHKPLKIDEARQIVGSWLDRPVVSILEPGSLYWPIFGNLLETTQVRGPLVMDAHLAALAIESGSTLCSTDRDFSRFEGLHLRNPLATR